ncbi:PEP-utilizing enzyme [Dehalococcoidia bacterium]|nr:PEP-utilizing enzyme [Dehalococcoidia bacterium]
MEKLKLWDVVPGYDFDEKIDVPAMHSWFLDATHCIPPWTPLFGWFWNRYVSHGLKYAAAVLSIPSCMGWEMRYKDGGCYLAFHIVRDEELVKKREVKFHEALQPWFEDFDGLWEGYKRELLGIYDKLKGIDLDKATNIELLYHNYELINAYRRMWEIHFLGMYASFSGWQMLETFCKDHFGLTDQSPEFLAMLSGFDNELYQVDKRLWEFGRLAVQMGLADVLIENQDKDIVPKLEQTDRGKQFVKEFYDFLAVAGWRMVRSNDLNEPYWLEDPAQPFGVVKNFIAMGGDYVLDEVRPRLARKREQAVTSMLQRVPDENKERFRTLLRVAQKASCYSEEHNLYCELHSHALMRRGYMAIGKRLADAGTIDQPADVFFLNPDEIERVMLVPEGHKLQYIVSRRRTMWEEANQKGNPLSFTERSSPEEAVAQDLIPSRDVIAMKVSVGEMPRIRPELKADFYGLCGAPGVAEGSSRVIVRYAELSSVRRGEILVCPGANPAWSPVFGIIKGIVADSGCSLSHTAIIAREYGIPMLGNIHGASTRIKTGQKIRINGNEGTLYILDK